MSQQRLGGWRRAHSPPRRQSRRSSRAASAPRPPAQQPRRRRHRGSRGQGAGCRRRRRQGSRGQALRPGVAATPAGPRVPPSCRGFKGFRGVQAQRPAGGSRHQSVPGIGVAAVGPFRWPSPIRETHAPPLLGVHPLLGHRVLGRRSRRLCLQLWRLLQRPNANKTVSQSWPSHFSTSTCRPDWHRPCMVIDHAAAAAAAAQPPAQLTCSTKSACTLRSSSRRQPSTTSSCPHLQQQQHHPTDPGSADPPTVLSEIATDGSSSRGAGARTAPGRTARARCPYSGCPCCGGRGGGQRVGHGQDAPVGGVWVVGWGEPLQQRLDLIECAPCQAEVAALDLGPANTSWLSTLLFSTEAS